MKRAANVIRRRWRETIMERSKIRVIRDELGLTQAEMADAVGCHASTVGRWEAGTRTPRGASARKLGRLALDFDTRFPPGWASQVEDARRP